MPGEPSGQSHPSDTRRRRPRDAGMTIDRDDRSVVPACRVPVPGSAPVLSAPPGASGAPTVTAVAHPPNVISPSDDVAAALPAPDTAAQHTAAPTTAAQDSPAPND